MNDTKRAGVVLATVFSSMLTCAMATLTGAEVNVGGRTFRLPDGFAIERIAGPPLVDRPIVGDFDEEGRLYLADSSGSSDPVKKQLAEKPHRIVRLEDSDGDGRFDKRTVFADRMMFPEGAMWYDGSLYVSAAPSIWKLTDSDGDGIAEHRVEWFQGKTLNGCANDLHGPYLGPDGWIYWCKGAFEKQTYERPGRSPFVTRAAHIFRCRPDGSGIEPVMTGGMDNPVDVVFTPGGERIFTTTFLQIPAGGRRDGVIHAVYGGVYGKVHGVIDGHPRTSPEVMPVLAHLGPAAPCGFTSFDSDAFGPAYRDNLFAALFNLHKVTRHVLQPSGATFTSRDEDFVASDDHDFHPTDLIEDADGSLIVIDTGGWYKLCCPTSQIGKPDVLGAVYRVRRTGAPRVADPRGRGLAWAKLTGDELAALLSDPRPAVHRRAIQTLARRGAQSLPSVKSAATDQDAPETRRRAVWAATQIDDPQARALVRASLNDADETVRQAAIHSVSVRRDHDALPALLELLKHPSAQNRRAAAEAIGRLADSSAIPALFQALTEKPDRVLEHSLIYALIEIDDPTMTALGLKNANVFIRRAALIALDQMEGGGLKAEDVSPALSSTDPAVKEAAAWIVSQHPEWGSALAGFLSGRLDATPAHAAERAELVQQLARFASAAPVQELLAQRLSAPSTPVETRILVLQAMAGSGLRAVPKSWISGLERALVVDDAALIRQAVSTARNLPLPKDSVRTLGPGLNKVASDPTLPTPLRLDALAAIPGGLAEVQPAVFAFLREELQGDRPVATRGTAANVLSAAKLSPAQLLDLVDTLKTTGPLEVDRLLAAFERSSDEALGLKLIATLKQSPALATLRVETLKPRLAKYGARVQREAEALYSLLTVDAAKQKTRLEELLSTAAGGDIRRGQLVFNSTKAACVSCHAIGYIGGHVGPDLTRIGEIRSERDLLEAIVFPSASFVRSFEPIVIATRDGKVINGLPTKDTSDEIVLATGPDQEAKVARDEIEEIRPGTVSVMPAGLDQQLTTRDLADLVAFLRACR